MQCDLTGDEGTNLFRGQITSYQGKQKTWRREAVGQDRYLLLSRTLEHLVDRRRPVIAGDIIERVGSEVGIQQWTGAPIKQPDVEALGDQELDDVLRDGIDTVG